LLRTQRTITKLTSQSMCKRNVQARSRNHCCRGKAISVTYSECVSVVLIIRYAMRMRFIFIPDMPHSTIFFPHYLFKNYLVHITSSTLSLPYYLFHIISSILSLPNYVFHIISSILFPPHYLFQIISSTLPLPHHLFHIISSTSILYYLFHITFHII
jgi:hypothetical protein